MAARRFELSEGSSHKFWEIELDGSSHTVRYGRIGTDGQTKTKDFDSDDDAEASCDKLIAQKTKKGYAEVGGSAKKAARKTSKKAAKKTAKKTPKKTAKKTSKKAAAAPPPAPEPESAEVELAVHRHIELDPIDERWLQRDPPVLERAERPAFDQADCCKRLVKVTRRNTSRYYWNWRSAKLRHPMAREEAHFWLLAIAKADAKKLDEFQKKRCHGNLSATDVHKLLSLNIIEDDVGRVIAELLEPVEFCELLLKLKGVGWSATKKAGLIERVYLETLEAFRRYSLPYATKAERKEMAKLILPKLDPKKLKKGTAELFPSEYYLAAMLGMRAPLKKLIAAMENHRYGDDANYWGYYFTAQVVLRVLAGLGDSKLIEKEARRLGYRLGDSEEVTLWLATTRFNALDVVRQAISPALSKDIARKYVKSLSAATGPEVAEVMLYARLETKGSDLAAEWLEANPGNAIPGLLATAAGSGKMADAALDYLRSQKRKGRADYIAQCVADAPDDVAETIRAKILDVEEKVYTSFDAKSTPAWLKKALKAADGLKAKLPAWLDATDLPPLVVKDKRLDNDQVVSVLKALNTSELTEPHAVLAELRERSEPAERAAFAWRLFQSWMESGAPSKEKWMLRAVGFFGGDKEAIELARLCRVWPGESQHPRAVLGLEVLRCIGSDTALMQLNGIAQKVKFQGLKRKARECMDEIAKEKGLTTQELEDRIVPDCDLDERGTRVFDFGKRQFTFVLSADQKPAVRDESGKIRKDLPKPAAKDDEKLATASVEAWKLLKKQLRDVLKIQTPRLEQAMVTGRSWKPEDFETLLVRHPLMTNLVRRLLWGVYDDKRKLKSTFRVTDELDYADASDDPCKLPKTGTIGIVHPLHLSDKVITQWQGVFGDYEIVSPFEQLTRTALKLEAAEKKGKEIQRLKKMKFGAGALGGALTRAGWERGIVEDAGVYSYSTKEFPAANLTAYIVYEPGLWIGYPTEAEDQTIERVFFMKDLNKWYPDEKKALSLSRLDAVAVSEILRDLEVLASKAK